MPRYLRWISAITTGIIVQIIFQIAVMGTFAATGRKEVEGATAAIVTFVVLIVNVIVALAINDWLAGRYPIEKKKFAKP